MPTYEYQCSQGHQYELVEGFDAPTEQDCPDCGSSARRVPSLPAVIFKGSGFYSTDNAKGRGQKVDYVEKKEPVEQKEPSKNPDGERPQETKSETPA